VRHLVWRALTYSRRHPTFPSGWRTTKLFNAHSVPPPFSTAPPNIVFTFQAYTACRGYFPHLWALRHGANISCFPCLTTLKQNILPWHGRNGCGTSTLPLRAPLSFFTCRCCWYAHSELHTLWRFYIFCAHMTPPRMAAFLHARRIAARPVLLRTWAPHYAPLRQRLATPALQRRVPLPSTYPPLHLNGRV